MRKHHLIFNFLFYPFRIVCYKTFPTAVFFRTSALSFVEIMTNRNRQTVRSIEFGRQSREIEQAFEHRRYLLFATVTVAGYRHFDFFG